ncbi:MAG TPA: Na+/H+ antiporter NhaA [Polyangia bacterium]
MPPPPGSWPTAQAAARRLLSPVERFLSIEAASGILLLLAAAAALLWANSPWRDAYAALLHTPLGVRVGSFVFERDVHFLINDGLMVVFFFVVGLEIRREIDCGELSELRRAALPAFAALGGMIAPACIFLAFNAGTPASVGWGVPMATDIAFAVGVLALLGKRVRPALRILLLALAVIDDLGAIVVIALFYSSGIQGIGLAVVAAGLVLLLAMQKLGVRSPILYVAPGLILWAGVYATGVHPTLAGVLIGLLTPVRAWLQPRQFVQEAQATADAVSAGPNDSDAHSVRAKMTGLEVISRETSSPVERLQHALHPWVAFVIMPIFALANAGVPLGDARLDAQGQLVFTGVVLGLLLGKPIGVLGFSWLAVRLRLAALPAGVAWREVMVVGFVAGIGFTMALFIAGLAFPPGPLLEVAKLGILCASALAAVVGLGIGRLMLSPQIPSGAAPSEAVAEASTLA